MAAALLCAAALAGCDEGPPSGPGEPSEGEAAALVDAEALLDERPAEADTAHENDSPGAAPAEDGNN
jgi:hypothetical protein